MTSRRVINRQQRDDSTASAVPPAYDPITVHAASLTKDQLKQALCSAKRCKCLAPEKRDIVDGIRCNKTLISAALKSVDRQNKSDQKDTCFEQQFNHS